MHSKEFKAIWKIKNYAVQCQAASNTLDKTQRLCHVFRGLQRAGLPQGLEQGWVTLVQTRRKSKHGSKCTAKAPSE